MNNILLDTHIYVVIERKGKEWLSQHSEFDHLLLGTKVWAGEGHTGGICVPGSALVLNLDFGVWFYRS